MSRQAERASIAQHQDLHGTVLAALREMIVAGALKPGQRIGEVELGARFGISRTPLREALKVLAHEQLVELRPNRGARVVPVRRRETAELFELLEALEGMVGELAAERILPDEIDGIAALQAELETHLRHRRDEAYFRTNQAIHDRLVGAGRNEILAATHASVSHKIRRARALANDTETRLEASFREHEDILATLRRRDPARLSQVMRLHVRNTRQAVLAALAADPE